jgi:hypothetical protein
LVRPSAPSLLLQSVTPPELAVWGRHRCRSSLPPLMGFASPPRRHLSTRVHSHQTRKSGFGQRLPHRQSRSAPVVSHHLDGFLRERAVSLLRLTAGLRFAAFPHRSPRRIEPKPDPRTPRSFPATRFTPLEGFPSPAAAPCHHGRCPLDVPLTHFCSRSAEAPQSQVPPSPAPKSRYGRPGDRVEVRCASRQLRRADVAASPPAPKSW